MKITTITCLDVKKLKDAAKLFGKKDATRPYLSNFLILKNGDAVEALASNGHIATIIKLSATLEDVERFQLSFDALKNVSDKENLEILQDDKSGLILKSGAMTFIAENVGEVPDVTRVMNFFAKEEAEFSFCVTPELFKYFTRASVKVYIKDNKAMIFDDNSGEKLGVMMLRTNTNKN
tara:strand:+ start:190 stop:723 length:534 start_codon:yes stop_codon:yes gene_type:complete